jgi:cytochrome c-type biogenesis protein CcmH
MTIFWISGALLLAAGLALVLRPLRLRGAAKSGASRDAMNVAVFRDQLREAEEDLRTGKLAQADYERARAEIERRLLEDVHPANSAAPKAARNRAVAYSALVLPLAALGIYLVVGNPGAINPAAHDAGVSMPQIEAMVQRLAERLEKQPDDVEGWKMLGKSYTVLGRFAEAANAYSKAAIRAPRDAQILADLADALAMARGQSMKGEPEELVLRALQIDPKNAKALALAGTAAFDRRDFRGAARYWERMLPLVEADSEDARVIQSNIDEARAQAETAGKPAVASRPAATSKPAAANKPAAAGARVQGSVKLAPELASRVAPTDTLFVYARAAEGPPMPLAILRKQAGELPLKFSLDDSMAMSPAMKLSAFARVVVTARISKSGSATPQPGDLQGATAPIANSSGAVSITIDKVVR